MNFSRVSAALIALSVPLSLSMGAAYAGEKTLEFQLVVKYLEPRTLDASNIEDQAITQAKGFGVAVFKDGRIGTKDFIMAVDKHKDGGTGFGYSTYKFEDGSITARFTTASNAQGTHGDYKVLSGTGAYQGATGSGTFDSVPNSFTGDRLYEVKFRLVTQLASK